MALTKVGNIVNESPGGRNVIINGDFNIWQRGTNFSPIATGGYGPDRFVYAKSGSMVHNCIRSTEVPTLAQSGHQSNYSLYTIVNTIDSSIADINYAVISHNMEGYYFAPLLGKTCNFSFWVKAYKTGTYCVAFRNNDGTRSYVVEYTVNASDTWEKKSFVISFEDVDGTWNLTNGIGLKISFILAVGSTYQGSVDVWQVGNYLGTSNQVNACDSTSNTFRLSQVQLEIGPTATDYENRDIQTELLSCLRYYMQIDINFMQGYTSVASGYWGWVSKCIPMRVSPTKIVLTGGTLQNIVEAQSAEFVEDDGSLVDTLSFYYRSSTAGTMYVSGRVLAFDADI